jgi:uncharacterized protein with GYD domain
MHMPVYVVLYNLTEQGRKSIKNLADRMDEAKTRAQSHGISVLGNYVTMGQYDLVSIIEAPSDEAIARGAAAIMESGNVTSTSMRAFTAEEWRQINQGS